MRPRTIPTGCLNDLFAFVMATYARRRPGQLSEGNEMGFYNAEQEQASLLKEVADRFTLSDNFHQSVLGGTGANHVMFGTGDAIFWSDGMGNAAHAAGHHHRQSKSGGGTVNKYTVDGNFSNCSDSRSPASCRSSVSGSLQYDAEPNCAERHYYMLNNTNPGFLPNGTRAVAGDARLDPAVAGHDHRRCFERKAAQLGLFRRRVQ